MQMHNLWGQTHRFYKKRRIFANICIVQSLQRQRKAFKWLHIYLFYIFTICHRLLALFLTITIFLSVNNTIRVNKFLFIEYNKWHHVELYETHNFFFLLFIFIPRKWNDEKCYYNVWKVTSFTHRKPRLMNQC